MLKLSHFKHKSTKFEFELYKLTGKYYIKGLGLGLGLSCLVGLTVLLSTQQLESGKATFITE